MLASGFSWSTRAASLLERNNGVIWMIVLWPSWRCSSRGRRRGPAPPVDAGWSEKPSQTSLCSETFPPRCISDSYPAKTRQRTADNVNVCAALASQRNPSIVASSLSPESCACWPVMAWRPPWSCCVDAAEAWPEVRGHVQASPPGSASGAVGSTSRPSGRPPRSSEAAAGSAAPPRRSRWRSELAGRGRSAGRQGLKSLKKREYF